MRASTSALAAPDRPLSHNGLSASSRPRSVGLEFFDQMPHNAPRRYTLSTCPNSSSTGVARPKIETATFKRERS